MNNIKQITPALSEIKTGTPGFKIGSQFFVGGIGGNFIPGMTGTDVSDTTAVASDVLSGKYFYTAAGVKTSGTGSGATNFYKCASVGSGTWTGYKAVWNSTAGKYEFETTLTSDALTFTLVTPQVNKIYSADALINATLWVGIPTAGLVFHAPLSSAATTTGHTLTPYNTVTYTTVNGIQCAYFNYSCLLSSNDSALAIGTTGSFSVWVKRTIDDSGAPCIFHIGDIYVEELYRMFNLHYRNDEISVGNYGYEVRVPTKIDTAWHHVAATCVNGTCDIYLDGAFYYSGSLDLNCNKNFVSIGSTDRGGSREPLRNGYVAGLRIYNRALSSSEIAALAGEFTPTA